MPQLWNLKIEMKRMLVLSTTTIHLKIEMTQQDLTVLPKTNILQNLKRDKIQVEHHITFIKENLMIIKASLL